MEVKKYARTKLPMRSLYGGMQYRMLADMDFMPMPYGEGTGNFPQIVVKENEIITLLEKPSIKRNMGCTAKILTQDGEIGYMWYSDFKKLSHYTGKDVDITGKNLDFNWDHFDFYVPGKPLHQ